MRQLIVRSMHSTGYDWCSRRNHHTGITLCFVIGYYSAFVWNLFACAITHETVCVGGFAGKADYCPCCKTVLELLNVFSPEDTFRYFVASVI